MEKIHAEIPKLKLEAEQAAEPEVPSMPEIKAPEGNVTVTDTSGLLGRLVGYRALDTAAKHLVDEVAAIEEKRKPPREGEGLRVLIVDSPDLLGSDWPYQMVGGQLAAEASSLGDAFVDLGSSQALPAPQRAPVDVRAGDDFVHLRAAISAPMLVAAAKLGPSAVSAAVNLAGLLRTDYTVGGGESKVGTLPMTAATARAVIKANWKVVVDDFDLVKAPLIARFWRVWHLRVALADRIDALRAEHPATSRAADDADIRRRLAQAEAVGKRFDTFSAAVTTAPKSGYPPLIAAARRQSLHQGVDGDPAIAYVVYVAVEGGGFESISRKTFWWWRNKRMRYLGGAQVSYLVYDVDAGETVAADNLQVRGRATLNLDDGTVSDVGSSVLPGNRA